MTTAISRSRYDHKRVSSARFLPCRIISLYRSFIARRAHVRHGRPSYLYATYENDLPTRFNFVPPPPRESRDERATRLDRDKSFPDGRRFCTRLAPRWHPMAVPYIIRALCATDHNKSGRSLVESPATALSIAPIHFLIHFPRLVFTCVLYSAHHILLYSFI